MMCMWATQGGITPASSSSELTSTLILLFFLFWRSDMSSPSTVLRFLTVSLLPESKTAHEPSQGIVGMLQGKVTFTTPARLCQFGQRSRTPCYHSLKIKCRDTQHPVLTQWIFSGQVQIKKKVDAEYNIHALFTSNQYKKQDSFCVFLPSYCPNS